MEDPAILNMNLERYWRLLESEADPAKRQTIQKLIRKAEGNCITMAARAGRRWRAASPPAAVSNDRLR